MKKYIIMLGLFMACTNMALADNGINIKAKNVFVKTGLSHHEKHMMISCMLCLKKHKTMEEAMEVKMAKISEKCEKHKIENKKCLRIKAMMAKKIKNCFESAEFVKEFFGMNKEKASEAKAEVK